MKNAKVTLDMNSPRQHNFVCQSLRKARFVPFAGTEITSRISKVIFHKRYSVATGDNDITLLKLAQPVAFNSFIAPACLPTSAQDVEYYKECYITGWGNLGNTNKKPTVLQQAMVG